MTTDLQLDAMAGLGAAHGSANWRAACTTARKERLNRGLRTLASWAQSRSMGEHDDETTLTMLERKTAELRAAVNKAGWDSVAASHSPNMRLIAREALSDYFNSTTHKPMQEHQQRVVNEKTELDAKLTKLNQFIHDSPIFTGLDDAEKSRLIAQKAHMEGYSDILGERIAAF